MTERGGLAMLRAMPLAFFCRERVRLSGVASGLASGNALRLAVFTLWGAFAGLGLSGCETAGGEPPAVMPPDLAPPVSLLPDEIPLKVAQRCPGDADCPDSGDGRLYVGFAKRDVTPEVEPFTDTNKNGVWDEGEPYEDKNKNGVFDEYWIAGYSSGRLALGVNDPQWARAIAIKQNQTTVVVVAVDTVGLFRDETFAVEKLLDPRLGIDLLMIHATHDHEAADLTGGWGRTPFNYGVNEGYQRLVRQKIAEAATAAVQGIKPARLSASAVKVEDAPGGDMNRYVADSRDPVVIDNTLHTLQFLDVSSTPPVPIATLVNWANHPEAAGSDNHMLTSDFVHYLREELEQKGAGPVIYVNGAIGGLLGPGHAAPLGDDGKPIKDEGLPKARALGKEISRFALSALADPKALSVEGKDARLSFRTALVNAHVENRKYHLAAMFRIFRRSFCCYDDKRPIDEDNLPSVETKVAYLKLGPVSIITNPGELDPEFMVGGYRGEYAGTYRFLDPMVKNAPDVAKAPKPPYLKDLMEGPVEHRMTFGLTMDFLGYILPRYNFVVADKNPYIEEAEGDHYEETNSIGPRAGAEIVGTMRQLLLYKDDRQP